MGFEYDVCVVGGCGHVGLPLAMTFAREGLRVSIHDINDDAVRAVSEGKMPFLEDGGDELLPQALEKGLVVKNDPTLIARAEHVVVVIGTPVDRHLNPSFFNLLRFIEEELRPHLSGSQCLILRSTVFPGTTEKVNDILGDLGVHVAFCPERVAQGKAIVEIEQLPQIISGCEPQAVEMAARLFGRICTSIIRLAPLEAELAKIFTNAWRYIQFATANQFLMMATSHGVEFYRIWEALKQDYPRMEGLPRGGFTAGPCLFKDTMQLAAADQHRFSLGHSAMLINEGLPGFMVEQIRARHDLSSMTVGIIGMTFKPDIDDTRESLSFKLRKILEYECKKVLCTDSYLLADGDGLDVAPLDVVLDQADLFIIAAPHREYRSVKFPEGRPVIDIWDYYGKGAGLI